MKRGKFNRKYKKQKRKIKLLLKLKKNLVHLHKSSIGEKDEKTIKELQTKGNNIMVKCHNVMKSIFNIMITLSIYEKPPKKMQKTDA